MIITFFFPRWLTLGDRRSENETKLAGEASYAAFRTI